MGLIQNIKSVSSLDDILMDDEFYSLIEVWKCIYQGYYKDWHDVHYVTIEGQKKRKMNTLRMAKNVSEELARLVFNEKVNINTSPDAYQEEIHHVFKRNDFYKQFQDYLEYMFSMGGMVVKVFAEIDQQGTPQIKLSYVTADCFIPLSYSNGHITEGIFVHTSRKRDKYYTHLEWHTWSGLNYTITNELYESDTSHELGVKVALSILYPDVEEVTTISGLSRPLFIYFKPNLANNFDMQSPLGISIFANAMDTLKALDVAFDSLINEFKLGKKRIIVPDTAIKTVVDPNDGCVKRYFDPSDEVYQAFKFDTVDNQKIIDNSVELRVEEHIAGINALLEILAMQLGFSSGSFTFDSQGLKTATEVVSENSKTFRTVTSHEIIVEEGIKQLITTIGEVAQLYNLFVVPPDVEVSIEFDDSITVDKKEEQSYYLTFYNTGLTSKVFTLMKTLGLTEEQATEMIAERTEEDKSMNPDDVEMFGVGG
jgi:A118 family predicted phage portal protein